MDADGDDTRWGRAYVAVLACLAVTVIALTILSQAFA